MEQPSEYSPCGSSDTHSGTDRNKEWGEEWKAYALQVEKEREEAIERGDVLAMNVHYLKEDRDSAAEIINDTRASLNTANSLLREIEWSKSKNTCPCCFGWRSFEGHAIYCKLAKHLEAR